MRLKPSAICKTEKVGGGSIYGDTKPERDTKE